MIINDNNNESKPINLISGNFNKILVTFSFSDRNFYIS